MKKLIIYLISFVLVFDPSILYDKSISIKDKTKFYQIIDCANLINNFNKFSECVEKQSLTSRYLGKLKNKHKREIFDILAIVNIINEGVNEGFVNDSQAAINWNSFLNSNYKKKSSKKKLEKILDDNICKNLKDYNEFINCFNNEFRNYEVYQNADIKTKERMEHIVFNSFILTKPNGFVFTLKKENLYGDEDYDKLYSNGDGYDFFLTLMNALGTDYFKKVKDKSDINWKKVITFIIIAILIAYMAKSLLKKGSSGGSQSSASSGSTSTAGATNPVNSATGYYNQIPVKYATNYKITYYKPYIDVTQKTWFKYAMKSRFGF